MRQQRIRVYKLRPGDRPHFKLQWKEPGTHQRRSVSAGTDDPVEAEKARADLEYELNHGLHSDTSRMAWEDFSERYLAEKLGDRRVNTRKKWLTISASFAERARPRSLGDVDASMLSRYAAKLRGEGREKPTVAGHLAYLRAALRWAARQGLLQSAPVIEMPKLPKKTFIRKTDRTGFEKILAAAPEGEWRLFITLAWFTGRRRGEVLALEWSPENEAPWLDLERNRLWLPAVWNKGDADFWMPLCRELVEILLPLRQERGRLFTLLHLPNEVSRGFTAIARRAGVPLVLHDFKRSFASRMAKGGVSALQAQRLCGHRDIRTTQRYYIDEDDLRLEEAIELGNS